MEVSTQANNFTEESEGTVYSSVFEYSCKNRLYGGETVLRNTGVKIANQVRDSYTPYHQGAFGGCSADFFLTVLHMSFRTNI